MGEILEQKMEEFQARAADGLPEDPNYIKTMEKELKAIKAREAAAQETKKD